MPVFLFTDIAGSTQLWEAHTAQMGRVLSRHNAILQTAIDRYGGRIIKHTGDGVFAVFEGDQATEAPTEVAPLACALEIQQTMAHEDWGAVGGLWLRVGLHAGEAEQQNGDYFGPVINRAARIMNAATAGQILLSGEVVSRATLPPQSEVAHLGSRLLKGLSEPQHLYALTHPALPRPPEAVLRTSTAQADDDSLPAPMPCPYKGLAPFEAEDASYFYGRESLVEMLLTRLATRRFLAVVGPSGSGKSSLVRAGLLPALARLPASGAPVGTPQAAWHPLVILPGAAPLESLAQRMATQTEGQRARWVNLARQDSQTAAQVLVESLMREAGQPAALLLVVDQFEELFTLTDDEQSRRAFLALLNALVNHPTAPLRVLITLRADFYGVCATYPDLTALLQDNQLLVGPLHEAELREVIERPAAQVGLRLEAGLVETILADVANEPGALPLLSHALLESWKQRRGTTMTLAGYARSGGVRAAIAKTAELVYQALSPEQQRIARNIFLRLTSVGEAGGHETRRRATLDELIPHPEARSAVVGVLKRLADARLTTTDEATVEVAHEALIREWPTLQEWLHQNREGLRIHRHLTGAAHEWAALGRDPGALYRGARLDQALEWADAHPDGLNRLEQDFLTASGILARQETAEREAQRQRELDAAQRLAQTERQRAEEQALAAGKLRQRALFLTGALLAAALLAVAALGFGQQARRESLVRATAQAEAIHERELAQEQARQSLSRELATAALNNLAVDPERSILLALQALSTTHTVEAENALHQALQSSRLEYALQIAQGIPYHVAWSPEGHLLAASSYAGQTTLWETSTGELVGTQPGYDGIWVPGTSPERASTLLTVDGTQTLTITESLASGETLGSTTITPATDEEPSYLIIPETRRLVTFDSSGTAQLWDVAEPAAPPLSLRGHTAPLLGVALSADGTRLATSSVDQTVRLWDTRTGELLQTLEGHTRIVNAVAFSPDGRQLVTAGGDQTARLWDAETGEQRLILAGHTHPAVRSVAWSPDGTTIATAGSDQTARLWDVTTGRELITLTGHTGQLFDVIFSPDGTRLATSARDGTVRLWNITPAGRGEGPLLIGHEARVNSVAWTAGTGTGGGLIATGGWDGTARIWQAETGEPLHTIHPAGAEAILKVAFHPDGSLVAAGGDDGSLTLWEPRTGTAVKTIAAHRVDPEAQRLFNGLLDLAWAPGGDHIATGGTDGLAAIWDTTTGTALHRLQGDHPITGVAFHPDGRTLATVDESGMLRVWDVATGAERFQVLSDRSGTWDVAWAPAPEAQIVAVANLNGTVGLWDLSTEAEAPFQTLLGHTSTLNDLAWLPHAPERTATAGAALTETLTLASTSSDGTVRLWNLKTGRERLTLPLRDNVLGLAFHPNGHRMAVASWDGTARIFQLALPDLIALANARLTRSLSQAECQLYLRRPDCS